MELCVIGQKIALPGSQIFDASKDSDGSTPPFVVDILNYQASVGIYNCVSTNPLVDLDKLALPLSVVTTSLFNHILILVLTIAFELELVDARVGNQRKFLRVAFGPIWQNNEEVLSNF